MTTFARVATSAPQLDPLKSVNWVFGMVVGPDDLLQEHEYLAARSRLLASGALGYGTVDGLQVRVVADGVDGPEVLVTQGEAIMPAGDLVWVCPDQCAKLNPWLVEHASEIGPLVSSSPPVPLRLFVVLCPASGLCDDVPIPGEPCRSEDDLMAPSRRRDSFRLDLRLEPPAQTEEWSLRRFAEWLAKIPLVSGTTGTLDGFLDAIRSATSPVDDGSPVPSSPTAHRC
jgi:hypothetical protein